MARVAWIFQDTSPGGDTYNLPVNPSEHKPPPISKTYNEFGPTDPDANTVLIRGRGEVPKGSGSGALFTQAQYDALTTWAQNLNQIKMTDHLGVIRYIIITSLQMIPERALNHQWFHRWTFEYTEVNWP